MEKQQHLEAQDRGPAKEAVMVAPACPLCRQALFPLPRRLRRTGPPVCLRYIIIASKQKADNLICKFLWCYDTYQSLLFMCRIQRVN